MNISLDAGEMESAEKRRYRRIPLRQPVQFQSQYSLLEGGSLSCDLGEGGIRVDMYDFLPLNTEVILRIRLAIEKVIEHVGRVVWIRKFPFADRYEAGLEFSKDKSFLASKQQLHEFIEVGAQNFVPLQGLIQF